MSALSNILNYGYIAVYGATTTNVFGGITLPTNFNFGTVYQVSPFEVERVHVGSRVLFNGEDAKCILAVSNNRYTIIEEAKLVTIGIDLA